MITNISASEESVAINIFLKYSEKISDIFLGDVHYSSRLYRYCRSGYVFFGSWLGRILCSYLVRETICVSSLLLVNRFNEEKIVKFSGKGFDGLRDMAVH